VCLFCAEPLGEFDEAAEKDNGFDQFPGTKAEIVFFSILIMLLTPMMIALLYLSYLQALDMGFIKHKLQQLKEAVVFEEKADKEDKEYYKR